MSDSQFLAQYPESFVGHLASPSVVKLDGRYYMAFVGSVDDRNLCAGEHSATNGCGSCADPWSYFVAMWAVSDDGLHWRIRQRAFGDPMLVGRPPDSADRGSGSLYKGITRVSMLVADSAGFQRYFYIGAQFWSMRVLKMAMFRIPYDPNNAWGIGGDPELWSGNQNRWVVCDGDRVPDFFDALSEISLLKFSAPLSSILQTRTQYLAIQIPNGSLAHYTACVNALDGSAAEGVVSVSDSGRSFADGLLQDGCAGIDLRVNGLGPHTITAFYNAQNLWQSSHSATVLPTVFEGQRRRAVRP